MERQNADAGQKVTNGIFSLLRNKRFYAYQKRVTTQLQDTLAHWSFFAVEPLRRFNMVQKVMYFVQTVYRISKDFRTQCAITMPQAWEVRGLEQIHTRVAIVRAAASNRHERLV